jgi:hypothetical protein
MQIELKPTVLCLAILILAFSVVVFSAAAKHSQFLPQSDPAHFLSNAAKMNVSHSLHLFVPLRTQTIPDSLPVPTELYVIARIRSEKPVTSQVDWTLCLQHRSPPLSLS